MRSATRSSPASLAINAMACSMSTVDCWVSISSARAVTEASTANSSATATVSTLMAGPHMDRAATELRRSVERSESDFERRLSLQP